MKGVSLYIACSVAVQGVSLSTTSCVDVQYASLSTACCMDGRVCPTYISSVDVVGFYLFTASSKEAQGLLYLFTFEQWTQCRCPAMILTELRCTLVNYVVPY